MIEALTIGSCTSFTLEAGSVTSGNSVGLLTSTVRSVYMTCRKHQVGSQKSTVSSHRPLYGTVGAVIITLASYSSSRRWRNTSMCNVPRKPNRHPWPRADDDSGETVTLRSVSVSWKGYYFQSDQKKGTNLYTLLMDSSNLRKSLLSIGNIPAYTCGQII